MNRFSLSEQLTYAYSRLTSSNEKPVIGITANYGDNTTKLYEGYYKQVANAGGVPVVIPPLTDARVIADTLQRIDALILSGGADINPLFCNEEPVPGLGNINAERDLPELLITRMAFNRQLPILGICRGIQTLAVALGGGVVQDIDSQLKVRPSGGPAVKHSQEADRAVATHTVVIEKDSTLFNIYNTEQPAGEASRLQLTPERVGAVIAVNSFHHQAVGDAGPHLRVVASAADGVVEAVESSELKPIVGVQWHPECMGDEGQPLFQWLVSEARLYREAQRVHDRILSLDTHCDTPMLFHEGVDFGQRDSRILVDLPKMTEGRLDATIMVAYLPQPKKNQPFADCVHFPVEGPRAYADLIFDKIETMAAANSSRMAIARTPDDLWRNKQAGLKSVMMGIENGLALECSLDNLRHFAERGIVYVTLCHNGDNDICDSARGQHTHGGVSDFGALVISEMNRLGIMVDLSHAAEESFYNALHLSSQPIVCSHSSARSLCDHPRNLTDDQMRALAQQGGVCQITLYHGFLAKDGEATIRHAMEHLEHAISVMGIDHVGLGTDFDGDGGVPGLADASELLNFTRQLLCRRFSQQDIQKIWGGNFLRVMRQVQQHRYE